MSAPKWTPGPWRTGAGNSVYPKQGGPTPLAVAQCLCEADANLIAAAPDLFVALRMILDSHDTSCAGPECQICGIDLARLALRRARGEGGAA